MMRRETRKPRTVDSAIVAGAFFVASHFQLKGMQKELAGRSLSSRDHHGFGGSSPMTALVMALMPVARPGSGSG
jgi:hypothetical protein